MSQSTGTCVQMVTPEDDCCAAQEPCGQPASWVHRASGSRLCDLHEENARRYSSGGQWVVGRLSVSFPEGWERLTPVSSDQSSVLEVVRFDS